MSNNPIPPEITPVILDVHFITLNNLHELDTVPRIEPAPPIPPKIAPVIAPENAPSSTPSQNEPPAARLVIPPATPPITAPDIAPQQAPAIKAPHAGQATRITTAAITITIVTIAFQCSLHHSPTFLQPSLNFSQLLFSHSGFR